MMSMTLDGGEREEKNRVEWGGKWRVMISLFFFSLLLRPFHASSRERVVVQTGLYDSYNRAGR